jgi:hypothetical protein
VLYDTAICLGLAWTTTRRRAMDPERFPSRFVHVDVDVDVLCSFAQRYMGLIQEMAQETSLPNAASASKEKRRDSALLGGRLPIPAGHVALEESSRPSPLQGSHRYHLSNGPAFSMPLCCPSLRLTACMHCMIAGILTAWLARPAQDEQAHFPDD